MKLKFKQQEFQNYVVKSVIDLFKGQPQRASSFSLRLEQGQLALNEFGYGNQLLISDESILANLREVQQNNKLLASKTLEQKQFSIEMETGTGKTYVYSKTIFELNQRYGFTKFIIVVPSVAIREGVYKSLQVTREHFQAEFDNLPYRYFIYNSKDLSQIRQFANSTNIEIMIINIDAFKKAENIINLPQDKLNGESAMRYIQDTNPIVIIDEPQSVDNTVKAKEAIASLNPLCVFRYSATHKEEINLLYRLTPVDAYKKGLVKQICVSSNQIEKDFNRPYIALKGVSHEHGFKARLELDVAGKNGTVSRKMVTVRQGDDLYRVTGGRELYRGYIVSGINCMAGDEAVEFSDTEIVKFGHPLGDVNTIELRRAQIYRTIETHLDKELRLVPLGIKVLSLFFIDEVAKYRSNDEEPALYECMFEECYEELLAKEKYAPLRTKFAQNVRNVHGGYFSQDKKGVYKDTKGDSQVDDDTYNTIMRDKEWLLSFACPLRFIFSHSALREGWDNPNVFQVCMLIEQKSNFTTRQKIGRGLRLCVNQQGEQVEDKDINVLHVMVNESFSEFVSTLQKELEADIGYKLGTLQMEQLVGCIYEDVKYVVAKVEVPQAQKIVKMLVAKDLIDEAGVVKVDQDLVANEFEVIGTSEIPRELRQEIMKKIDAGTLINVETLQDLTYTTVMTETKTLSSQEAADILVELREKALLTSAGKITDTLKMQWAAGTLDLSERFSKGQKQAVLQALEASQAMPIIRNATREVRVKLKKQTVASPEFLALWEKINKKTTYRAKLDCTEFVVKAVDAVEKMPPVAPAHLVYQTAEIELDSTGVTYEEKLLKQSTLDYSSCALPNIVNYLTLKLKLTAKTIISILIKSGREHEFVKNPQAFLERIEEILNKTHVNLTIDGIKYLKLVGQEYSVQEFFTSEELVANLERTAVVSEKSVYDHVVYESSVEKEFAQSLENDPEVRLFFKLPRSFKIATPIGSYTPDWAVFLERDGEQKLYFVLETKGANSEFDLRLKEMLKIKCGKAHFDALQTSVVFNNQPVTNWREYKRTFPEAGHEFPSAMAVVAK
ncbi:DEAD/DEAH box helicase family protein [Bartonella sp. ML70XJBT]|uniref:restriction endonuclease n=1 Tax=Bartonella sp. ML70XJBT TaxID=3019096 RepID=UPI00235E19F0|nr:DEAD/DEAH box helicase family protein [Bartonella sp. ML70XJBT]